MKNHSIYLIIILLISSCGKKTGETSEPETIPSEVVQLSDAQLKQAGIQTGNPEYKNISAVIKLNGSIDVPPQNIVSISFPLGGYLKSTKLLPGMHVNKGEILAVLEDAQFVQLQQEYLIARSRLEWLQAEYNRQEELNATKAGSDKVFQQAKTELEQQKIMAKSISEKLKLIGIDPSRLSTENISRTVNLYSPINGFVSSVNVNIGKYTSPTDVLFELVNPEDIHLNLTVFENDVNKLKIGQKVMAFTNDDPDNLHPAEIILISKNLDENRAAEVHCHFNDYDKSLLPGMYMQASVEIKNHRALTVPVDAIVQWEKKHFVFCTGSKNTFEMVEVIPGALENKVQEITGVKKSLDNHTRVVTLNAYTLLMKLKNEAEEE